MKASFSSSSLQYAISIINSIAKASEQKSLLNPIVLCVDDTFSYIKFHSDQILIKLPLVSTFSEKGDVAVSLVDLRKHINTDHITVTSAEEQLELTINGSIITIPSYPITYQSFEGCENVDELYVFPNGSVQSLFKSAVAFLPLQPPNYNAIYIHNGFVKLTNNIIVYIQDVGDQYNGYDVRVPFIVANALLNIQKTYSCALSLATTKLSDYTYYRITPDRFQSPIEFVYREPTNLTEHNHIAKVEKLFPFMLDDHSMVVNTKVLKSHIESALKVIGKSNKHNILLSFDLDKLIVEAISDDRSSKFSVSIGVEPNTDLNSFQFVVDGEELNKALSVLPSEILLSLAMEQKVLMVSSTDHKQTVCLARA